MVYEQEEQKVTEARMRIQYEFGISNQLLYKPNNTASLPSTSGNFLLFSIGTSAFYYMYLYLCRTEVIEDPNGHNLWKKNWKEKTKGFWIVWCRLVQNQRKTIISCCWYSKWNFIKILGMDNLDNNTSTLYLENRSGDCSLNTSCNSFR